MRRTPIVDALQAEEASKEIKICGWVRTRRDAKGFSFLELNDGSCLKNLQAIVDEAVPTYEIIKDVTTGAAVEVLGELVPSPGKGQKWEVRVTKLALLGSADADDFPLQKKRHSDEFLRQIAHLRPRTNKYGAAFRIRSEAAFAVHKFYRDKGFFNVHTPILTGSDCEGAGEMFRVSTLPATGVEAPKEGSVFDNDFFGREANLTVSGQLEAELLAMGLGKVYTFGPTFRAENSNTPRHAAEFWMIEPEVAFADNVDNMDLAEEMTKYVVKHILENCADDIELFAKFVDKELMGRLENIINEPFARVSYTEAVDLLLAAKKKWEFPVEWGIDLQTEHERYLAEEHFKKPVIVYDYPKDIKAFYMRLNDDGKTVAAMDVLVPRIGELIGGSQREERMDVLLERINEMGQNPEDYWWYTDLRRFGSVPHAGFGMGFERLLMLVTGITNIRDVIPFPRTPQHIEF
ncbi:asparagine--tRNA ligase [Halodesulfovibrio spirochaetisodalis]|uniref:Asparagine--tRNA ligase n=1 Tax=Halodesulfovibrio spirochaetisodalis TaxID=1560234 RepID=A0A1B7XH05_9BACT|nr:asparagine--tRNA ligase [Halodesulfovibrio spirochaetisodalis]OBQ54794.1 asparaginyl-tRNA synthetase [Halodesulfovibrio spirochaetisodalis]